MTARDAQGHEYMALTADDGIATLELPAGGYTVFSTYCGGRDQRVTLTSGATGRVQIVCAVP